MVIALCRRTFHKLRLISAEHSLERKCPDNALMLIAWCALFGFQAFCLSWIKSHRASPLSSNHINVSSNVQVKLVNHHVTIVFRAFIIIWTQGTVCLQVGQAGASWILAKAFLPLLPLLLALAKIFIVIVQLKERWMRWSEFTVHYALHENEEKKRKEIGWSNYKLFYMTTRLLPG